jgi:hypothetical protein
MAIALVWLGGQFVTQGLSDYFLDHSPELAVLWRGDSPDALVGLARARVASRDYPRAALLAQKALRSEPLNEPALAVYGVAVDGMGKAPAADRALTLAGQRNWRDLPVHIWLMRRRLLAGNYAEGLVQADAILRRENEPPPLMLAILAAAALDPRAIDPLVERMRLDPPWRTQLLGYLAGDPRPSSAATEQTLLLRLAKGPTPPTEDELGGFLWRQVGYRHYQDAQQVWLALTPGAAKDAGLVRNGGFERPVANSPFDWALNSGPGWTPTVGDAPASSGKALRVEYDGVSPAQGLRQLLILAPGGYQLTGRAYDEGESGADTLTWTLTCADTGQSLASAATPGGGPPQWRAFRVDLSALSGSCSAEWLTLTVRPGDVRKDVAIWYDDLAVKPLAPSPTVASVAVSTKRRDQ